MSEEEKKAIEILHNWLCDEHSKFCRVGAVGIPNKEFFATEIVLNLVKNLIAGNKELKEENGRLREKNINLKEKIIRQQEQLNIANKKILAQRGQLKVVNNSYIPISKLKEKMELLREDIQYSANPLSIDNSKYAIEVLEELLEEGE